MVAKYSYPTAMGILAAVTAVVFLLGVPVCFFNTAVSDPPPTINLEVGLANERSGVGTYRGDIPRNQHYDRMDLVVLFNSYCVQKNNATETAKPEAKFQHIF